MARSHVGGFKPADRRWVLLGMGLGGLIGGMIPAVVQPPVEPVLLWVLLGGLAGFVLPSVHFLIPSDPRGWWKVSMTGAGLGMLLGMIIGLRGDPLPREPPIYTATVGYLLGYAVVELYLRRVDAHHRQLINPVQATASRE